MQLELLPGCEYPQAIGALFAEYTDMLVREDPAFASYLELQHYDQEVAHLEQKYGPPGGGSGGRTGRGLHRPAPTGRKTL